MGRGQAEGLLSGQRRKLSRTPVREDEPSPSQANPWRAVTQAEQAAMTNKVEDFYDHLERIGHPDEANNMISLFEDLTEFADKELTARDKEIAELTKKLKAKKAKPKAKK